MPRSALRVSQAKSLLDPLDATVHAVQPGGQVGILIFEDAKPTLDLAHVLSQAVNGAAYMPQVLEDEIVMLRHQRHSIFFTS